MSLSNMIARNHLFATMPDSDFDALKPLLIPTPLEHNQVLSEPGSAVESVYFPVSAILSVITLMEDGQGVEACTMGFENAYGLVNALGSPIATDRVIAQVPGLGFKLPTSRLRAAAGQSPVLTDLMVRHIQSMLAQIEQSVACNVLHPLEARLCRWLLMSQDRTANGILPLTQEFLGFMLGVQRTSVTIAARALQAAGLIRYSRGQINILDRAGLEEGACECYAAVQLKQEQLFSDCPRLR